MMEESESKKIKEENTTPGRGRIKRRKEERILKGDQEQGKNYSPFK